MIYIKILVGINADTVQVLIFVGKYQNSLLNYFLNHSSNIFLHFLPGKN